MQGCIKGAFMQSSRVISARESQAQPTRGGFCAGSDRAIDIVNRALDVHIGPPI